MKKKDKDTQQNKTKLICYSRNDVGTKKDKKIEDSGASTQGLKHHQPVPSQYKGGGPRFKGFKWCGLVVWGKGGLYLVFSRNFFSEYIMLG